MTKPDPAEALARHIADQPFSVVQRALRVLDWPLRFEIREDAEPPGPAATEPASPTEAMTTTAAPATPGLADGITEPAPTPQPSRFAGAIRDNDTIADTLRAGRSLHQLLYDAMKETYLERALLGRTSPREQIETLAGVAAAVLDRHGDLAAALERGHRCLLENHDKRLHNAETEVESYRAAEAYRQAAADTLVGRMDAIRQQTTEGLVEGFEQLIQRAEQSEAAVARVRAILDDPYVALDWRQRLRNALDKPKEQ